MPWQWQKMTGTIVLDLLLPGMHDLEVLGRAREKAIEAPIVIPTAMDQTGDVIRGLDLTQISFELKWVKMAPPSKIYSKQL